MLFVLNLVTLVSKCYHGAQLYPKRGTNMYIMAIKYDS